MGCQFFNQLFLGRILGVVLGVCFSSSVTSGVTVIRKAKPETATAKAATTTQGEIVRTPASRSEVLQQRYVLEHRETKRVVIFHDSTVAEVVDGLISAQIDMEKWQSCSNTPTAVNEDIETIEMFLDMELLIDALAKIPAPELNDAQREWVKSISPCDAEMRLHLKALALILGNYKLIKKPNDA
jgi:hypothetical protein